MLKYSTVFFGIFTKGDKLYDCLFTFLAEEGFQNGIYSEKKEFALIGANSFF